MRYVKKGIILLPRTRGPRLTGWDFLSTAVLAENIPCTRRQNSLQELKIWSLLSAFLVKKQVIVGQ